MPKRRGNGPYGPFYVSPKRKKRRRDVSHRDQDGRLNSDFMRDNFGDISQELSVNLSNFHTNVENRMREYENISARISRLPFDDVTQLEMFLRIHDYYRDQDMNIEGYLTHLFAFFVRPLYEAKQMEMQAWNEYEQENYQIIQYANNLKKIAWRTMDAYKAALKSLEKILNDDEIVELHMKIANKIKIAIPAAIPEIEAGETYLFDTPVIFRPERTYFSTRNQVRNSYERLRDEVEEEEPPWSIRERGFPVQDSESEEEESEEEESEEEESE